jgi:hypothetical protein
VDSELNAPIMLPPSTPYPPTAEYPSALSVLIDRPLEMQTIY